MCLPPRPTTTLDVSHWVDIVHTPSTLASPSSPTPTLENSHRVMPMPANLGPPPSTTSTSNLDVSHRDNTYHDEDDWERPTLGNQHYPPAFASKNNVEHEYFRVNYPYDVAISCTKPLVS